jgi:hypothetical protein
LVDMTADFADIATMADRFSGRVIDRRVVHPEELGTDRTLYHNFSRPKEGFLLITFSINAHDAPLTHQERRVWPSDGSVAMGCGCVNAILLCRLMGS